MKKYKILLLILFIIIGINYSNAENKKNIEKDNFNILVKEFQKKGYIIKTLKSKGYEKISIDNEENISHVIIDSNNMNISIEKYKSSNELNLDYLKKIENYENMLVPYYFNNHKYIKKRGFYISYEILKNENLLNDKVDIFSLRIHYKNIIFKIVGPISNDYKKILKIFLVGSKKFGEEKFINSYGNYFIYSNKNNLFDTERMFIDINNGIFILKEKKCDYLIQMRLWLKLKKNLKI